MHFGCLYKKKGAMDYIICTGNFYSIKKFIELAGRFSNIKIKWKGKYPLLRGYNQENKKISSIDSFNIVFLIKRTFRLYHNFLNL